MTPRLFSHIIYNVLQSIPPPPPRVLCSSEEFSLKLLRMWEGLWTKENLTCPRYCQSHACHMFPTLKTLHNAFGNATLVVNFHMITWPKGSGAIHGQCENLKYKCGCHSVSFFLLTIFSSSNLCLMICVVLVNLWLNINKIRLRFWSHLTKFHNYHKYICVDSLNDFKISPTIPLIVLPIERRSS